MFMDKRALDFLKQHRVCSLTTLLVDGSPHAAALHYSHTDDPTEIYISTENNSRKCQALLSGAAVKGAFVIGFDEEEFVTLQINGEVKIVKEKDELAKIQEIHYAKHPESKKYKDEPGTVFLVFKPTWWRYTEYNPQR